MMSVDRTRYVLPDTIDPGVYQCIKVYVPTDTMYIGAFWNAYEFFTKWVAWERDETHKAAAAAAVWRIGFEIARTEYEAGEECTVTFELRDDPDDPCKVQQSLDGGTTWIPAFTKDGCDDAVVDIPPFPDDPEAPASAAGAALTHIYEGLVNLNADCALSRGEYIAAATVMMRQFDPTYSNPAALGAVYDAYCSASIDQQTEAQTDCYYTSHHDDLKDCYDGDGVLDYLNCLSDTITDWLTDTSDALMDALNKAAASLTGEGWQAASGDIAGIGGGGGFGAQCDWCHEFDFTSDDYDTFPHGVMIMQDDTVYSSGIGYQNSGGGQLSLQFQFDAVYEMTYLEFTFESDGTFHHDSERARIVDQHATVAGQPNNPYTAVPHQHKVHSGGGTLGKAYAARSSGFVQLNCWGWEDILALSWPEMTVTHVKICGVNADPFV